ncbi:MAG: AI-2E family transporter [Anaerolineae bacterium]|nr:AI-2E family transporter [Anaerolineae bacterium]
MDAQFITSPAWSPRTRRTVALIALLVVGVFAWRLGDMWPPIIIALVLAYLLSPIVGLAERWLPFGNRRMRRMIGTVLGFVTAILAIVIVLLIIVPAIGAQLRQFGDVLPALYDQIERLVNDLLAMTITIGGQTIHLQEFFGGSVDVERAFTLAERDLATFMRSLLGPLATPVLGAVGTALSGIISAIFVLTMVFYLMRDGPRFTEEILRIVPAPYRGDVQYLLRRLGEIWNAYLRGQLLLCLTMGVVVFTAATILGLRNPVVLGLLSGVLEFIPNLGPALALIPAALFGLFFPSQTIPGLEGVFFMLVVIVVWTGLQNLEAILLVPRIMGNSLDLHPFIVIVAVIGGATLAGALGVILAAPVVASLRLLGGYLYLKLMQPEPGPLAGLQVIDEVRVSQQEEPV